MLEVMRDYPEIEDIILSVEDAPLDLPTEDHFTHIVADSVLTVNEEHYIVIYLGTGGRKDQTCNALTDLQSSQRKVIDYLFSENYLTYWKGIVLVDHKALAFRMQNIFKTLQKNSS